MLIRGFYADLRHAPPREIMNTTVYIPTMSKLYCSETLHTWQFTADSSDGYKSLRFMSLPV